MKLKYTNDNERMRCEILMNNLMPVRERLGQWLMLFKNQHDLTYREMSEITGCIYTVLVEVAKNTRDRILPQKVIDRLYLKYDDITIMEKEMLKFVRMEAEGARDIPWEIICAYASSPSKVRKYCKKLTVASLNMNTKKNIGEKNDNTEIQEAE